ncbi:uncharacterized protein LY89DRAFT_729085 [Mollisia scopiformis]|uniref:Uncharacterized protein n=1 Tax=Mollisia scopiformis TaxID=149040 RepID=A0A194XN33_MOLSC|nr:uncharacterized protein LY89DRAFT_729085 [Mollisia scopiformis]KUJ21568.1 hypothetical protein LY89DRAFT_729085 [Mollisia scopiformis]
MCCRNNISYRNGTSHIQRRPTLLRQLAEHLISKRQAKKALARSSLIETSSANQFLFESERPLAGGQRVIHGTFGVPRWVDEQEETRMTVSKIDWENGDVGELPPYRA